MVWIDQEHGPIEPESLHAMVAGTAGTPCSPWVRVPGCDEAAVKTALDAGAEGPRTASDNEANQFSFSPVTTRSLP